MGTCFGTDGTVIAPNKNEDKIVASSSRKFNKSSKSMIGVQDFMGIKKSDSIDNFYKI